MLEKCAGTFFHKTTLTFPFTHISSNSLNKSTGSNEGNKHVNSQYINYKIEQLIFTTSQKFGKIDFFHTKPVLLPIPVLNYCIMMLLCHNCIGFNSFVGICTVWKCEDVSRMISDAVDDLMMEERSTNMNALHLKHETMQCFFYQGIT